MVREVVRKFSFVLLSCIISQADCDVHLLQDIDVADGMKLLQRVIKNSLFSCGVACEWYAEDTCLLWTMDLNRKLCRLYGADNDNAVHFNNVRVYRRVCSIFRL